MWGALARTADLWIARRARRDPSALAAIEGRRPAVVVTGASRGIGQALAAEFARHGHDVVLVARGAGELASATAKIASRAGGRILALPLDVTHPDAVETIDGFLQESGAYLDVLVNNAALGLGGPFEDSTPEAIDALVALNVAALTRLMRHALPAMKARARGGILNIASLGGAVPGPYQAAYYASKAYVVSLTVAVAVESAGSGVRVTAVAPGPVETGFHASMGAESAPYRLLLPAMSPAAIAGSAYRAFVLGRRLTHPGLLAPVMAVALKTLPHAITVPLVSWLLDAGSRRRRDSSPKR